MTSLKDSKPKNISGAYERLFDDPELGALISKVQSAVIRSGAELEKLIADSVQNVGDLDEFLEQEIIQEGIFLAHKKQIRESNNVNFENWEPDFMVFEHRQDTRICYIVELKDGHVFDTKKALSESQSMHRFVEYSTLHNQYSLKVRLCAFNQDDQNAIWEGFKRKIEFCEAMTGREFCDLLEIDYETIIEGRRRECSDNVKYFLAELSEIESIRPGLLELLDGKNCK